MVNWQTVYRECVETAVKGMWPVPLTFDAYESHFNPVTDRWVQVCSGKYILATVLVSHGVWWRNLQLVEEDARQQMRRHIQQCPPRACTGSIIHWE